MINNVFQKLSSLCLMRLRFLLLAYINRVIYEFFGIVRNIFPLFLSYLKEWKDNLHEHFKCICDKKVPEVTFFGQHAEHIDRYPYYLINVTILQ